MRTNTLCNPLLIDNTAVRGTFGMMIKSREFVGFDQYRMGFNGKEFDPESTTQDYGMRIYDGRLGRFLSVDPLVSFFPYWTPYNFAGNTPIQAIDMDGKEIEYRQVAAFFGNGGVQQAVVDATETLNFAAKAGNDANTQIYIGIARFGAQIADGLGTLLFMGSLNSHDMPDSYYGSPCGMPGNKNADGTLGLQQIDMDPIKSDINKIISGDIATKTEGVLGLGMLLIPPAAEEASLAKFSGFKPATGAGRAFAEIAEGATDITIKNSSKNLFVEASAQESWGNLMAKFNKNVDDLSFSNDGSTSYFTTDGGKTTYALYFQKSEGNFVGTPISETTVANGEKSTTKLRFTNE